NEKVLSNSWLKERFELFENFCFPSVINQTNLNFKWLVFFDINTPEEYKLKIEEYRLLSDNFQPFYIDGMDSFLPSITQKINEITTTEYVITSRLDNDDSLHKEYVATIQNTFDFQDYLAVDVVDGYGMQTGFEQMRIGKMRHLYNPYISLIEKREGCKSVWSKGHTYWKYEKNIIRIKNKRLWLTIIHEKNKSNKFRGYGNVDPTVLSDFNIIEEKRKELLSLYDAPKSWRIQNLNNWKHNYIMVYSKEIKKYIGLYKIKVHFDKNKYD
ncbi:MAG: putative rhamnosyl transferase, partial [Flavobacteriaceae bacterium]|nr:putative rhamnosyl transferase [Flavobacteriaceae bacterium]